MKSIITIILTALSLITFAQSFAQNQFQLFGTVTNSPSAFAILYCEDGNDTIPIQKDGSLSFQKTVVAPCYATFMIPKVRMFLGVWIQNGKDASITLNAENPDEVILQGSAQGESAFMKEELLTIASQMPHALSFSEYVKTWEQLKDSLLLKAKELDNPEFFSYQQDYLQKQQQEKLSGYNQYLLHNHRKADADIDYNHYMESLNIREITNSNSGSLFNYLRWKSCCKNPSETIDYCSMIQVLGEEVNSQSVKDELAFRLFRLLLTSKNKEKVGDAYQLALNMTSPEVQQKIQSFYLSSSRPEGSEIPDFNILDINEQPICFKSVCNRSVVYVDVWSTWCVPCVKEIPYVAKLVKKYKDNQDIKFISLSIDKNRGNWKKFLANQEDKWEQYLIAEDLQREFFNIFAINGIPRFMIFDRQGRIISIDAPRPSAENLEEMLNGYIKKYRQ